MSVSGYPRWFMNRHTRIRRLQDANRRERLPGRWTRDGRGDTRYDLLELSLNLKCKKLYNLYKNYN